MGDVDLMAAHVADHNGPPSFAPVAAPAAGEGDTGGMGIGLGPGDEGGEPRRRSRAGSLLRGVASSLVV